MSESFKPKKVFTAEESGFLESLKDTPEGAVLAFFFENVSSEGILTLGDFRKKFDDEALSSALVSLCADGFLSVNRSIDITPEYILSCGDDILVEHADATAAGRN